MTFDAGSARTFRLLVTGGGTGGHTYPALTTLRTIAAKVAASGGALEVLWVGDRDGLEARVCAEEGIRFEAVAVGKIRRSSNPLKLASPTNVRDMARVPLGVAQARRIIAAYAPDVVLSTGGYVAIPVGLASRAARRPLVVHEQTVRLGLANKVLAKVATTVAVSSESTLPLLPEAARSHAVVTGNPVRPDVLIGRPGKAVEALGWHGHDRRLPTVYVTGGAQGSQQINTLVAEILPWLLERSNVVHQCGRDHVETLRQGAARLPAAAAGHYFLAGYMGAELPDVLALADVVVSRSGAGTVAELTALGRAAVFIPLASSAGGEQAHNARHLADAGAATALLGEVSAADLRTALAPLLADPVRRAEMAARARQQGRPDAAERLADVVMAAAHGAV
ncbi:UDP-N-acetylglucosamine--N-acetylmuramyl-(pentapeptide) pyrophosphoryl-undecaprenol N-acetylglucosamine transferase [Actinomadura hibisca]|uniref:UDP-N-acetylglucosamine--N-acetylmuramyl- (pentapeptide) pyrophosphoryl-undecaprenol N-acetylglucosamine transferase n=1 Tax=Actinomadura hibisca TaxID=68565 RepID=UPI00082B3319|nr:UDP-N-acetylglucosamine--N-acetylmuramyl-(pentapeptide) pyrophosphoryl-undecaprenol N-acetylglucosamine transferase [Actinomadura hibisca]